MINLAKINDKIIEKLDILNISDRIILFYLIRIISSVILFVMSLIIFKSYFWISFIVVIIYYLLFEFLTLDIPIFIKRIRYEEDAVEYFKLLLLAYNGTGNLKKGIIITNRMIDNSISVEMNEIINEVDLGKSLKESLSTLKARKVSTKIDSIILSLVENSYYSKEFMESTKLKIDLIDRNNQLRLIAFKLLRIMLMLLISIIMTIFIYFFLKLFR